MTHETLLGFYLYKKGTLSGFYLSCMYSDQRHWKQGVKLLAEPVTVGTHGSSLGNTSAEIETSFNPSSGELNIKYVFT